MAYPNPRDSVFNQPKPVVRLDKGILEDIAKGASLYPIPAGRKFEYGTAGVSQSETIYLRLQLLTICLFSLQFRMKAYVTLQPHQADTVSLPPLPSPHTSKTWTNKRGVIEMPDLIMSCTPLD